MRTILLLILLLLPLQILAQGFYHHFVPTSVSCSKLEGMVAIDSSESMFIIYGTSSGCNAGTAFWMIIDTSRSIHHSYYDRGLNSYTDVYLTDTSFFISGRLTSPDVINFHNTKLQEFDYSGELNSEWDLMGTMAQRETTILPYKDDILLAVEGDNIYLAMEDTLLQVLNRTDLYIQAVDSWNESIYFTSRDTLYQVKDYSITRKEAMKNTQRPRKIILTGESSGYMSSEYSIFSIQWKDSLKVDRLYTDTLGISLNNFHCSDQNRSFHSVITFCDLLGWRPWSVDSFEYRLLSFASGKAIDTVIIQKPGERINGFYNSNSHQITLGTYSISNISKAFLRSLSNINRNKPCKDLSIEVVVDSSWAVLSPDGSSIAQHVVDFHLIVTNNCSDEVQIYDLFSEDVIYFLDAEFRDYINSEPIGGGATFTYLGQRIWNYPSELMTELCYVVQAPDGYLDDTKEDNIGCDSIPYPIEVSTANINKYNLKIFPNPTFDYLSISTDRVIDEAVIVTPDGEVVRRLPKIIDRSVIDLSDFSSGIYFIRIGGSTGSQTFHFIKI